MGFEPSGEPRGAEWGPSDHGQRRVRDTGGPKKHESRDPVDTWVEDPHVPGAITHRGHAEVKRYFESMPRYGEELRFEPERFVDYGDEVLALARVTTRARRGGPEIDRAFDAIFTVRDGKIVRLQEYYDHAEALEAAGLSE
jgi:ketosteroid isomerase-like protein